MTKKEIITEIFEFSEAKEKISKFIDTFLGNLFAENADEEEKEKMNSFRTEFNEKFPTIVIETLTPVYEEFFTEEELQQVLDWEKSPIGVKIRELSEKINEKVQKPVEDLFNELGQKYLM